MALQFVYGAPSQVCFADGSIFFCIHQVRNFLYRKGVATNRGDVKLSSHDFLFTKEDAFQGQV